jgi:hypothetical protein
MNVSAMRQQPAPPRQPVPWSALQHAASDLGETQDGRLHLDGVRWDIENTPDGQTIEKGVFSDAFINPAKLKDVYLCIKPFTENPYNVPGHALLKFEFEPDAPVTNSLGQKDAALAVSIEQHFHQGEQFDPNAKNPVLHQVGTWTDAIEKATLHDHNPLHIYKMKLTPEQKVDLLEQRLAAAVQNHDNDMYDAINNSCLSNVIDGINLLVPEEQQIPRTLPDGSPDPSATVPVWCPNTFLSHGLLAQPRPDVIPAIPRPQSPAPQP